MPRLTSELEPWPPVMCAVRYSGSLTAEEHPVDDRVKRLRLDRSTGERGDRLGRRVRLLRCDAAVLDGEVGCVAGGVDALETHNLAVGVDRDEPVVGPRAEHPAADGPNSSGSAITRSTYNRREPGLSDTCPGAGVSQCAEGMNRMPLSSSSRSTAVLASDPNNASGASSGVASVTDMSTFMS